LMDKRWILSEEQLQQMLLVKTVLIGVPKTCIDEELENEASKGIESERNQAFDARHKHDKAR